MINAAGPTIFPSPLVLALGIHGVGMEPSSIRRPHACATMARGRRSAKGLIEMAGTVVTSGGASATFEAAFNRAVVQSERLRVSIVLAVLAIIMVRWASIWLLFPGMLERQLGGALNLGALGMIGLGALVYEATVLARLAVLQRRDKMIPKVVRYANALVEVTLPTLAVIVGPEVTSPA